jgi:PII-like signaling protein
MLMRGKAQKVTVYLNEDTSSGEGFIYEQVMKFLYEQEVAGATLMRPQEGFGSHHLRREVTRRSLPIRIEFIDSPEVVEAILPALSEMVTDGLIEMHETTIVKAEKREAPL